MKEKHPLFACQVGRHLAKQVRPLWKSLLLAANTALTKTHGCLIPTGNFWGGFKRRNTLKSTVLKRLQLQHLKKLELGSGACCNDIRPEKIEDVTWYLLCNHCAPPHKVIVSEFSMSGMGKVCWRGVRFQVLCILLFPGTIKYFELR